MNRGLKFKRKKLISFLVCTVFITQLFTNVARAITVSEGDTNPPIFKSITSDKISANVNDTVNIYVDAIDLESDINQVSALYTNIITGKELIIPMKYNKNISLFVGKIKVNEYVDAGDWTLTMLRLQDAYGNEVIKSNDAPKSSNFSVINNNRLNDTKPPVIKNINFDKTSYKVGELMRVSLDIQEVENLNIGVTATIRRKGSGLEDNLVFNEYTKKYEGIYKVTNDFINNPFVIMINDGSNPMQIIEKKIIINDGIYKDEFPTLINEGIILDVGEIFNPDSYISAKDKEDGYIRERIKVIENTVDTSREGEYKVSYSVVDYFGNKTELKDVKVEVRPIKNGMFKKYDGKISAGITNVLIKEDGSAASAGMSKDFTKWSNVKLARSGGAHVVGLKNDGTVVTASSGNSGNWGGQLNVELWRNIVNVSASFEGTLGLRNDGTVVAAGQNNNGELNVGNWRSIVDIESRDGLSIGVYNDGKVIIAGDIKAKAIESWTNIAKVRAGEVLRKSNDLKYANEIVGLRKDGTVIALNHPELVSGWADIVDVDVSYDNIIGLKSDGTVVSAGGNTYGQSDVQGFKNIVAISANCFNTLLLKSDGTLIGIGANSNSQNNINEKLLDKNITIDKESVKNNGEIKISFANNMYLKAGHITLDGMEFNKNSDGSYILDYKLNRNEVGTVNLEIKGLVDSFGNEVTKSIAIKLTAREDINSDWKINEDDLSAIAKEYNKKIDTDSVDKTLDLNKDGIIDLLDIVNVATKM